MKTYTAFWRRKSNGMEGGTVFRNECGKSKDQIEYEIKRDLKIVVEVYDIKEGDHRPSKLEL